MAKTVTVEMTEKEFMFVKQFAEQAASECAGETSCRDVRVRLELNTPDQVDMQAFARKLRAAL